LLPCPTPEDSSDNIARVSQSSVGQYITPKIHSASQRKEHFDTLYEPKYTNYFFYSQLLQSKLAKRKLPRMGIEERFPGSRRVKNRSILSVCEDFELKHNAEITL
jgi:hypothetical protein